MPGLGSSKVLNRNDPPVNDEVPYHGFEAKLAFLHDPVRFQIYQWKPPRPEKPEHFVNASNHRKQEKEKLDEEEKVTDFQDGADDWLKVTEYLDGWETERSQYRVVASIFKKRAKRAFWAGKTWEEFARAEEEFQFSDPTGDLAREGAEHEPSRLNNALGVAVFDEIAPRLCNEIWSQPWGGPIGTRPILRGPRGRS